MRADYHMHTNFSDDSQLPMKEAVEQAIAIGLEEICFTEHIDYGVKTDTNCDCDAYQAEIQRCREIFGHQIQIKMGMEFGIQTHTIGEFQETYQKYPFDFIILSCHQVENQEFWTQEFQQGKTQKEYNERYYDEILQVIRQYKDYSVLGHLDMIVRYDENGTYPFSLIKNQITEILKQVIADGRGIELNTSSFRYHIGDLTPSVDVLKRYKELGGEIITLGSDAHVKQHIGYRFEEIRETLKSLGFQHHYTYERMKAIAHLL